MCIKVKIIHYWFPLLVICVSYHLFGSVNSGDDNTCSNANAGSNTSINEDTENQSHSNFKTSNDLQGILDLYQSDLSSSENSSLKKTDFGIYATEESDIKAGHVVPKFHPHSSSSSSQLDTKGYDVSKHLHDQSHLNYSSTETFHLESDITRKNISENEEIKVLEPQKDRNGTGVTENLTSTDSTSEDIPSFREWTEKHLAEEEKGRADDNVTNVSNGKSGKMRNKNYASLDCGAKILSTNPEAKSAGSLLSTSRDEYLLSACNSKTWFIVELCEAVQLKRIEVANFELFSSSPKEFLVLISDRFPSRDWSVVGQFTAKDVKSIQSFDLQQPHHFTKYIKVEIQSHYGNEHFCPVSLFRVYGTSEFEVLETVDGNEELDVDSVDSDFDMNEPIISNFDVHGKEVLSNNNLFGSAKQAVINMVKKAAEVLVINPSSAGTHSNKSNVDNATNNQHTQTSEWSCVSLRYSILCQYCKENFFDRLHELLSCHLAALEKLLLCDLIWKPLIKYNICMTYGFTSFYLRDQKPALMSLKHVRLGELYAPSLMSDQMIAALCNLIAISENRTKPNTTISEPLLLNQTLHERSGANQIVHNTLYPINEIVPEVQPVNTFQILENVSGIGVGSSQSSNSIMAQIKPSKSITDSDSSEENVQVFSTSPAPNQVPMLPYVNDEQNKPVSDEPDISKEGEHADVVEDSSLDSLISELERTEETQQAHAPIAAPKPTIQKESVFVRLANRIKALERNMSLSGQYLEELSKRYKKQVEDMQRVLSEVTTRETKRHQEVVYLTGRVTELTSAVERLLVERLSWSYKAMLVGEHSLIVFLEIAIFIGIICLCRGFPKLDISKRKFSVEWKWRQTANENNMNNADLGIFLKPVKSQDDLNFKKPHQQHKRRPSEEAMKSDGNAHQHLLIHEMNRSSKTEIRRRKRKRRELLLKSNANAINLETGECNLTKKKALAKSNAPLSRSASASEIDEHSWGRSIDHSKRHFVQKENIYQNGDDVTSMATSVRMKRHSYQFNGNNVLSPVCDVSSDQDSSLPSTPVKDKKMRGLKKIVKKFF